MKQKVDKNMYESLASLVLPEGILKVFEVSGVEEENTRYAAGEALESNLPKERLPLQYPFCSVVRWKCFQHIPCGVSGGRDTSRPSIHAASGATLILLSQPLNKIKLIQMELSKHARVKTTKFILNTLVYLNKRTIFAH